MRKSSTSKSVPAPKSTALQRVLTTAVNDLGMDTTVAILNHVGGPFIPQVTRGFSEREVPVSYTHLTLPTILLV